MPAQQNTGMPSSHALGVDRVHLLVVDRHLRERPGREHARRRGCRTSSWAGDAPGSPSMPSLGSTRQPTAMNRSGCARTARRRRSSPCRRRPCPLLDAPAGPSRRRVTPIGSSPSSSSLSGTSLNMYSTGNSNSSFDSVSCVWLGDERVRSRMSACGKPIIVSMIPMSTGASCAHVLARVRRRCPVEARK